MSDSNEIEKGGLLFPVEKLMAIWDKGRLLFNVQSIQGITGYSTLPRCKKANIHIEGKARYISYNGLQQISRKASSAYSFKMYTLLSEINRLSNERFWDNLRDPVAFDKEDQDAKPGENLSLDLTESKVGDPDKGPFTIDPPAPPADNPHRLIKLTTPAYQPIDGEPGPDADRHVRMAFGMYALKQMNQRIKEAERFSACAIRMLEIK